MTVGVGRAVTTYRALASSSRVEILYVLQERGELPLEEIARSVGLHPNTTRDHLDVLVDAGFVDRHPEHRGTRGRPRMLYAAGDAPGHSSVDSTFREHFTKLLVEGYCSSHPAADSEAVTPPVADDDAQRATWNQLAALEVHFEELGLRPEVELGAMQVHLRRCPFVALAQERTQLVCSVHLGIARGVLEHEGGPVTAERLDPIVEPNHCILHLGVAEGASGA